MSNTTKMHENELPIDADLVRRLLAAQFPEWAGLPLKRVESPGTDNALYRLGDPSTGSGQALVVRLPRIDWAISQIELEARWLPVLAPHLPYAIPVPIAQGEPGEGYPWHWSINPWLEGENATLDRIDDPVRFARDLARFITALQRVDTTGGPRAGTPNFSRGVPLAQRDASTRRALGELAGMGLVDTRAAAEAWDRALEAPEWDRPPVWVHGDLQAGNLLVVDSRLNAVIDWGCLAVGDPAVELSVAWNLLTAEAREAFREALGVDDATWARGRGWALSLGLVAIPYYHITNPFLTGISLYAIDQVLADHEAGQ